MEAQVLEQQYLSRLQAGGGRATPGPMQSSAVLTPALARP